MTQPLTKTIPHAENNKKKDAPKDKWARFRKPKKQQKTDATQDAKA